MKYRFKNVEEAIYFGSQATREDCLNLHKVIRVFQVQYDQIKQMPKTLQNHNRRIQIRTWQYYCRLALEEARLGTKKEKGESYE